MTRSNPCRALAWLAAGVFASAAGLVQAQPQSPGTAAVADDPAGAWEAFLANATLEDAYGAYEILTLVDYGSGAVDPAACAEHRERIPAAVASAPVSIAVRHVAFSCAEALGDDAWATGELAALSALSRHALEHGAQVRTGRPIRIVAPPDAYALLRVSGVDFLYEFYERVQPARYYPLVVAAWDEDAGRERHLRFDFIDATNAILHGDTYSGFPFQRNALVDSILGGHRETGDLAALDIGVVAEANGEADPMAKAAALRTVAGQGGVQAARTWLLACAPATAPAGCADGLVEALLPQAEAGHAVPTMLLAFAYGQGIGTEPSAEMAARLLDAASARWPGQDAIIEYTGLWDEAETAPRPDWLATRLEAAVASGDARARLFWLADRLDAEGATLTDADRAFLAQPQVNTLGEGFGLLAAYAENAGDSASVRRWLERAADAGHPGLGGVYAFTLLDEAGDEAARRALRPRFEAAAHDGHASSARYLSALAQQAGDWKAAHDWLLGPASAGNVDAIFDLATIIEEDREGFPSDLPRALRTYEALASENDSAEARRRLARLALGDYGLEAGPDEARAWLLADAERGDAESQAQLGLYLLRGEFGDPDQAEAERWLLQAVGDGNELAIVDFGAWLYYQDKSTPARLRALALWQNGDEAGLMSASNNLAWALCTSPDAAVLDPARGLGVALAMDEAHDLDAAQVDTVAACHAAAGDFDAAVRVQQEAIDQLEDWMASTGDPVLREQLEAMAAELRERLDGYRAGTAYVEQDS